MTTSYRTSVTRGLSATLALLGAYLLIVSLVSGWRFAGDQFSQFWYYVIALAAGFGMQVGLYAHLKQLLHRADAVGTVAAITGTTSTAAMVSCCAHYLVNILPILGATGIATIATQYQVKFFWVGIAFNLLGIAFIVNRIITVKKTMNQMP